jgi:hypothetical protein
MGRRPKHSIDLIISLWDIYRSNRKIAKILKVDEATVRQRLKKVGIVSSQGNNRGIEIKKWSRLINWCRRHPNEVLPRKMERIVEMTGLSRDTIKSFFYRRKRKMKQRRLSRNQTLTSRGGKKINLKYVDNVSYEVDEKSGLYKIKIMLGSQPIFIQAREADLKWEKEDI